MDPFIENAYLYEIRRLSKAAFVAVSRVDNLVRDAHVDELFASLDDFLNASAKIAQFLWPTQERLAGRGERLRAVLRVSESSPIKDKSLRNYLEHFDENLDKWSKSQADPQRRRYIDLHVGLRDLSDMFDDASGVVPMRHYVPNELVYLYSGKQFEIQPLAFAIRDVMRVSEVAIQNCQQAQSAEIHRMILGKL